MARASQSGRGPWLRFGATRAQWRDWRWQQRHAVGAAGLAAHLALTDEERAGLARARRLLPVGATPYYLSLADPADPFCPVRMQIVPRAAEGTVARGERADPLGEEQAMPVPGLVHRYPDRALFLATDRCATYCRHCTRRRRAGRGPASASDRTLERAAAYVRAHPGIRDVLVSGGDPLLLSTQRLARVLRAFRAVPHVEILRVGTRMPVTNPMRVTAELVRALRRLAPLFVVTHFNHPKELTAEARAACERLVDAGVPVENQTVLLRRLNSSPRILAELFRGLLTARVRPYYLHQMDVAAGVEHLRTPLEEGVRLLAALRGSVSGLAVPHFAVDLPGGGGKVTLQPDYVVSAGAREVRLRNWQGRLFRYPQPVEQDCACPYEAKWLAGAAGC